MSATVIELSIPPERNAPSGTSDTIRRLADRYGHIQETIVQPFHAKDDTPMRGLPSLSDEEVAQLHAAGALSQLHAAGALLQPRRAGAA